MLIKVVEAEGCEVVGITTRKRMRVEIARGSRRYKITASNTPTDFDSCVNCFRQSIRRTIAMGEVAR